MRRSGNPVNALTGRSLVPDADEGVGRVRIVEECARSIITQNKSPDIPYRWSVNPYRGCQHACAYCYARRTHEYLELGAGRDFECTLIVKVNAAELLAAELRRPSWRREALAFSGVTDCYQPLEGRRELTRRCLEVCCARAQPVNIATKSDLVLRDAELLREIGRRSEVCVMFSIPFADDGLARDIEPGAASPSRRFAAMRGLAEAGVAVGLLLNPVIPGLNDREIPAILKRAAEAGAGMVGYAPVRLPGSVGEVFLSRLRARRPLEARRVEARIREMRGGRLNDPGFECRMSADGAYWKSVRRLFETMATRYGLDGGQEWRRRREAPEPPDRKQLELFQMED